VGCYVWYSEEGTGRDPSPPRPLLAVPNVTAHPSTASVPITVLLYNGPLLCGFNLHVKGLKFRLVRCSCVGRPDHPYDVHLTSCGVLRADVAWSPGSDNNDPVVEYIIYHNTSFDETGQFTEAARVSARRHSAAVRLQPWTNYTFSVRARNSLGLGERSAFTPYICTTPQSRPYRNPSNVCSVSRAAHQLVIVWEVCIKFNRLLVKVWTLAIALLT